MKKAFRSTIIFIFHFIFLFKIAGQRSEYHFESLKKDDGLSSNQIRCIFQDSMGFMWFGTDKGLDRYDGVNVVNYRYDLNDSLSISDNDVTAILEESGSNNLWIATFGGLNYFDRRKKEFTRFVFDSTSNSVSSNYINCLAFDKNNTLWMGTNVALDSYKNGEFNNFPVSKGLGNDSSKYRSVIISILIDSDSIWVGTEGLLYTFDLINKNFRFKNYHPEIFDIRDISKDKDNNIWVNTKLNGSFIIEEGENGARKFNDIFNYNSTVNTQGFFELDNKMFIINRNKGLNILSLADSSILFLEPDPYNPNSISGEALMCGFKSKDEIIWLGTFNSGIDYYDPRKKDFGLYTMNFKDDGLINDNLRSIFQDSEGNIWIGTKENGCLSQFNKETGTFKHFLPNINNPHALHGDYIFCIDELDKDNLLVGTLYNGINIFNKKSGYTKHIKMDPDDPNTILTNTIYDFYKKSDDEIWIATLEGMEIWNPKENSLKHISGFRNTRCFFEEDKNRIWVGTLHEGIFVLDSEANLIKKYQFSNTAPGSLGSNRISSIKKGPDNKIWICTGGSGLNYFIPENESFGKIKMEDGLPSNHACEILFHNENEYWLSTDNGLSVYFPNEGDFKTYDKSDGLQGNEFADYVALQLPSGELIFGGLNGFNIFNPEKIKDNKQIPDIVFTDFYINNKSAKIGSEQTLKKSIEFTDKVTLSYKEFIFSIGFVALNYLAPEKNQYKYMLEGFENEWMTIKDKPFVTYTNIPPGDYTFKVIASNNDGYWNNEGIQLKINILPPWWETIWFRALFVLIVISGTFYVYYLRVRNLTKRRIELEQLVNERTKELRETHSQLIQSEKMASLGILTAGVAHEINNPLNFIQAGIYSLENLMEPDVNEDILKGRSKKIIDNMKIGVERVTNIVKSLNAFSRKGSSVKTQCDLHEIIENCLTILNHEIKNKCQIIKNFHTESIILEANKESLHQVFLNVLMNSIQAIRDEGEIVINTQELLQEQMIEVVVSDNGAGIEKENLKKIFDPFFTTKEAGEGTGLGLSLVYKIISIHKGKITIESELDKGTEVKIYLPYK